jgi:hypothetical protein
MFRDSTAYIDRYFDQVDALDQMVPVRLVVAEGDSTDDTYERLGARISDDDRLVQVNHGGPKWGSIDHKQRWSELAFVGNTILDLIDGDEPVIWVESDLIWDAGTMMRLLDHLDTVDAVAPMSMRGDTFYDTWGHRGLDGVPFTPHAPYHPSLTADLVPISSAGSCVAMRPDVAKVARFGELDCIVGLCRDIREHGYGLWLDPELKVTHP